MKLIPTKSNKLGVVFSSHQEKDFFEDYAKKLLDKIRGGKKKINFDVAFFILNGFETWKKERLGSSFRKFLDGLVKAGKCPDKFRTFKLTYYVARVFGDLEEEENRKLSFESYRKIANAKLFYKRSLSKEENEQENRKWQRELRKEAEGATVIRADFEEKNLDFDAILPKLIQKGYVTQDRIAGSNIKEADEEFRGWFPQYTADQFNEIQDILKIQKIRVPKIIPSTQLPRRIKEIQTNNGLYIEEGKDAEDAVITYYNFRQFYQKFKEYFNPTVGEKYKIELIDKD